MNGPIFSTLLILGLLLPFALKDGKRYKVILAAVILLLPFYQGFIYFRHMVFLFTIVLLWLGDDRQMLQYTKEPINRSMIVFFLISLMAAFLSADITRAFTPICDLMFFYLVFLITSVGIKRQLTTSWIPGVMLVGLLSSVFIQTMQLLGLQAFYIYDEASLNTNTAMSYENLDRVIRYWGPFGNALTFSSYLAVFGLFLFGYYNTSSRKRTRLLSYGILIIAIYGVLLTAGRTALVSMVAGLVVYAFMRDWKKALLVVTCLPLVMLLFSTLTEQWLSGTTLGMYQRFTNLGDDKNYRTELWVKALPVLLDNPLFGTGPGNLSAQIAPLIRNVYVLEKEALDYAWGHVENTYLSVLYTFGLSGFGCFLFMLGKSYQYSFQATKQHLPQPVRQVGYGLTTAWVVMGINMFANPVFVTDQRLITLMLLFVAYSVQVGWSSVRYQAVPKVVVDADIRVTVLNEYQPAQFV